MARLNLTRPRIFGIGLAVASLAFASCGHSSSTSPTPVVSPATAVPTSTASVSAFSSPCAVSLGQAYEPDGGSGAGFHGIQVTRFEANDQQLCSNVPAQPVGVTFQNSVGALAFSPDFTDGLALVQSGTGYSLAQDLFGASVGQLVPAGTPYNLAVAPTTAPTAPGASPAATASPIAVPLIGDATSISIIGSSAAGIGFAIGPAATPAAIVALTSLANAPPQYGSSVPLSGSTYTLKTIPAYPRSIVRVSPDGAVMLARGPSDLLSFGISTSASGYLADAKADDTTLGYGPGTTLRGNGAIAFSPATSSRALVGGSSSGTGNVVTLVTGLPAAIARTSQVRVPGTVVRSIAISNSGAYAVVATDAGISVVSGVSSGVLALATTSAALANPTFRDCAGRTAQMTSVYSVGLSAGTAAAVSSSTYYLVALGTESSPPAGAGCVYPAAIVAVPFDTSTGSLATPVPLTTPTAAGATAPPASFTQNNVIAPPAGADYLIVH